MTPPTPRQPPAWRRALAQNWTGVLGAVITVAGVGFFGVYASFKLGPVGRFVLIDTFAALLFLGSRWLLRFETWRPFVAWLQAIAGAIVLLACLGASSFERLRFISDPTLGWLVLGLGIGVNLLLAYLTPQQAVASLHVLLSLTALAVPPQQGAPTLLLATLVTAAGILLSYRSRWDANLLVALLAYAAFHHAWVDRQVIPLADFRAYGIGVVLAVGASAALVHYRQEYRARTFQWLPFVVHVLNWGTLGFNLVHYSRGSSWATLFLALAAAAATALARVARREDIRWLYASDTLVGQLFALLALARLGRVGLTDLEIAILCHLELLVFNAVASLERERFLLRVGLAGQWAAVVALTVCALDSVNPALDGANLPIAGRILVAALATLAYLHHRSRKGLAVDDPRFVLLGQDPPAGGAVSPLTLALAGWILLAHGITLHVPASASVTAVLVLAYCAYPEARTESSWIAGSWIALLSLHALGALALLDAMPAEPGVWVRHFAPVVVLDLVLFWRVLGWRCPPRLLAYVLTAHVALGAYTWLEPISDFAPGVAYLLLSLVALEIARLLQRSAERAGDARLHEYVLQGGFFYLALFVGRHLLVHLQSEQSLGRFSARVLISVFGLAVVAYWLANARAFLGAASSRASRALAPFLTELFLALLALTVAVELEPAWHPVAWAALALALLALARPLGWTPRLHVHAWLFDLTSAIQLAFVSSTLATPHAEWYHRTQFTGPLAIALQLAFVVIAYRRRSWVGIESWPDGLRWLGRLHARTLARRPDVWIFYPLVASIAVFLYWRFDRAVLTLLWVVEIFLVFALGVFLRQRHFVHVANATLVACIGRLVLYDLARTDVSVRAIVFIAVGLLMLGINAMYRKFGDRVGTWPR
jgi:hypothetical protein